MVWHITFKVGDVFAARICKPEGLNILLTPPSGLQGFQNVGAGRRGNGRIARDLADRSPGAALYGRRNANRFVRRRVCVPYSLPPSPPAINLSHIIIHKYYIFVNRYPPIVL